MKSEPFFNNFTGGEVSPRFAGRVDAPDYARTVRTLENLIVHPSGGVDRRSGTYYCGGAKTNTGTVRLIPFVASSGQAYVLELSNLLIRVWKDGALVQSGGGNLEIAAPWAEADLFELKYAQAEDSMYFAHPDYLLYKLNCYGSEAWSITDQTFSVLLSVVSRADQDVILYNHTGDVFQKIPDPDVLPSSATSATCFSQDGKYLCIGASASPWIYIYKRGENDVFTKLANPANLPGADVQGCAFSYDNRYLVLALAASPYLAIYKRSGDTFTKLSNPGDLPGNVCYACAFSHDNTYLAIGFVGSPYIIIYKRSGDTFTKLANPAALPTGTGNGVAFTSDGLHLVVAHAVSPYVTIYRRSGDTFTKIANPQTLPTGTGAGVGISPNDNFVVIGHTTSPYITIYQRSGDTFTKLANPASLPDDRIDRVSFSPGALYMACSAHGSGTKDLYIYKRSGTTFTKLSDPADLPDQGYDCMFCPDGWEPVPWDAASYPAALTFHEQRLVTGRGRTIWASRVGYPQDFSQDAADASYGYEYDFASDVIEQIRWMATKQHNIVIGTSMGEWLMTGGNAPISASNVYIERASAFGSADIQGVVANESILYVQKNNQRLREFLYSQERGGYLSPDLTWMADHIGRESFVEMAWQRSPRPILWVVRANGTLAALTYDRNHDIQAWHRHPTDGEVESVAVIPGTSEDIVYMLVKRTIDGSDKKYVEYMKPLDWGDDQEDCFLVDCGATVDHSATTDSITGATKAEPVVITAGGHPFANDDLVKITGVGGMTELNGNVYMVKNKAADTFELYETDGTTPLDGTGFTTYTSGGTVTKVVKSISGLSHLEAKSVAVFADGAKMGNETVSSGSITIDDYATKIHIGIPYTPQLQPQRLVDLPTHYKRIDHITLRLYQTLGAKIGQDANSLDDIPFDSGDPPAFYTGDKEVPFRGGYNKDGDILITQPYPLPLSILALFINADTTEI